MNSNGGRCVFASDRKKKKKRHVGKETRKCAEYFLMTGKYEQFLRLKPTVVPKQPVDLESPLPSVCPSETLQDLIAQPESLNRTATRKAPTLPGPLSMGPWVSEAVKWVHPSCQNSENTKGE